MSDTDENIRTRAYLLWESKAVKAAEPDEYWYRAKELIEAEHHAAYPPPQALPHHL